MVFFISKEKFTQILLVFLLLLIGSGCMLQAERYFYGVKKGVILEEYDLSYYLKREVEEVVTGLALEKNVFPEDASIDKKSGQIIKPKYGRKIKISDTVYNVMQAQPGAKLKLQSEMILPQYDEKYFLNQPKICSFVTWFYGKDSRYQNIKIALQEINNTVVYPNEIFSFNKVVGPRTPKRGFQKAPSIGIPEDYGGGVCQVASTLYNAVQNGKFRLIERHEHSKPVKYVTPGKDATVYYGFYDLKFQNNRAYPIIINTSFKKYGVRVNIYGGGVQ